MTTFAKSRVDLKKSPSSRIGQPREKQSDDLKESKSKAIYKNQLMTATKRRLPQFRNFL